MTEEIATMTTRLAVTLGLALLLAATACQSEEDDACRADYDLGMGIGQDIGYDDGWNDGWEAGYNRGFVDEMAMGIGPCDSDEWEDYPLACEVRECLGQDLDKRPYDCAYETDWFDIPGQTPPGPPPRDDPRRQ